MPRGAAVREAYRHCLHLTRKYHTGFPVPLRALPGHLRGPMAAIHCFARRANDAANEDTLSTAQRLAELDRLEADLRIADPDDPMMLALRDARQRHALPRQPFIDLLDGSRQDARQTRYADFGELMAYCRRSANPIGRLLLQMVGYTDDIHLGYADAICSGLQLIRLYQSLDLDYQRRGRIYLPQDEMARFGVSESHIRDRISDVPMRRLMQLQYRRADRLLRSGAPLGKALPGRLGLGIRMTVMGGARVLYQLGRQQDPFSRPQLRIGDRLAILRAALLPR